MAQPVAAFERAGFAVAETTIAVTAHITAITAAMMGSDAPTADPEAKAVGVQGDRLHVAEQNLIDDIAKAVNIKDRVGSFGRLEGYPEAADAAAAEFDKEADGAAFLAGEMFFEKPCRLLGHDKLRGIHGYLTQGTNNQKAEKDETAPRPSRRRSLPKSPR